MPEPVSLTEAKRQVRMADDDSEDTFLETDLIPAARAYIERVSRYFLVAATRTETFSAWGDYLEIFRRPIASVTSPIVYTDEGGDDANYTGFLAPLGRFPFRIYPAIDDDFPTLGEGGVITVTYTSGALSATSEEYLILKRAILLLIGIWFDNRGERPLSKDEQFALDSVLAEMAPVSAY